MDNKEAIKLLQEADKSYWSFDEDKALSHAIEVMKASEWQTIETANDYFQRNGGLRPMISDCGKFFIDLKKLPQPPKEGE
jgi:hypothetical protein